MTRWSPEEEAVLTARTRALARAADATAAVERITAVEVIVAGEPMAIEANVVHVVADIRALAPLPHAPPGIAGLVYHEGVMLPAFHLRSVLGIGLAALPEVAHAVLVGEPDGGAEMALIVDAVTTTREIDPAAIAALPESASAAARDLFLGVDADRVPILSGRGLLDCPACRVNISLTLG